MKAQSRATGPRGPQRGTTARHDKIVKSFQDGKTPVQIAEKIGQSTAAVYRVLSTRGFDVASRKYRTQRHDEIVEAFESGMRPAQIAKMVGNTSTTVYNVLRARAVTDPETGTVIAPKKPMVPLEQRVVVPKKPHAPRQKKKVVPTRAERIRTLAAKGKTPAEIAKKLGMTRSHVLMLAVQNNYKLPPDKTDLR